MLRGVSNTLTRAEQEWRILETAFSERQLDSTVTRPPVPTTWTLQPEASARMDQDLQSRLKELPVTVGRIFGSSERRFRERSGVLMPYSAIQLKRDESAAIRRIICGSNYGDQYALGTIKDFLFANGWGSKIEVEFLKI